MIEVKSADTVKHPPLDVDEVVTPGQRSSPRSNPAAQPPAPPAQQPPTQQFPAIPTPAAMPVAPPVQAPTATYPTFPTPQQAAPAQVAPTTPPPGGGPQMDWGSIVAELQAMAEDSLGNRARKVKDILGAADPSLPGIEGAIDQVPSISLLFVDSSRLEQLAQEMRARLKSHL
jgi:hypothetical protein